MKRRTFLGNMIGAVSALFVAKPALSSPEFVIKKVPIIPIRKKRVVTWPGYNGIYGDPISAEAADTVMARKLAENMKQTQIIFKILERG